MELTFLGSSNAFAAEGRYWSSFIADRKYLFDAPPTLLPHLKQLKVNLLDIEIVFLSHHHGDHFMGMPFLYLEYLYMTKREAPLYIVGPPGVKDWIENFAEICYPSVCGDAGYERVYIDARPRTEQRAGNISFTSIPMSHDIGEMDALGYRVHLDGKTVAYTGDTMLCDQIYELADGADVLVVDCTYAEGSGPVHMGIDDIKIIRKRLPLETTIILTHLNGQPNVNGLENVVTAQDLKTFRFD